MICMRGRICRYFNLHLVVIQLFGLSLASPLANPSEDKNGFFRIPVGKNGENRWVVEVTDSHCSLVDSLHFKIDKCLHVAELSQI